MSSADVRKRMESDPAVRSLMGTQRLPTVARTLGGSQRSDSYWLGLTSVMRAVDDFIAYGPIAFHASNVRR